MYRCVRDLNFISLLMVSMEEIASNTLFLLLFLSEPIPRAQDNEEDGGGAAGPEQRRTAPNRQ